MTGTNRPFYDPPRVESVAPAFRWGPLERDFGIALAVILLGYAFLGKGFAYLHIPLGFPLYVGEIVLVLGLLATALRPRMFSDMFQTLPAKLFIVFFALGVIRTVPYVGQFGINAARDAAIYYYGLFMLLVYELVRERSLLERIASTYGKVAMMYVFWVPAAYVAFFMFRAWLPGVPGTDVPLLWFKGGDTAVHLAGAVAFFILVAPHLRRGPDERSIFWYLAALVSTLVLMGRAAYLSVACALAAAFVLGKKSRFSKPVMAALLAVAVFLAVNPKVTLPSGREISIEMVTGLARSIFTTAEDPRFREGTKRWRLMWWSDIVSETFFGPYFWGGRGFGTNLADVHGFQTVKTGDPRPLRSPHNSHVTVLARMGVAGFLLWLVLQATLAWRFYTSWRRAKDAGDRFLQGILAWVLCYWVASVVNSSFDVYLEGPQGAIWFWSIMGLGLAATSMEPTGTRAAQRSQG